MLPLTTMQKVKLAITVGKKILAAKDAHDTKKAMETHGYLSAVENQEGAMPATTAHVIALTHLANSDLQMQMGDAIGAHSIKLMLCRPGSSEIGAFLVVDSYSESGTNHLDSKRICALPLSASDVGFLGRQLLGLKEPLMEQSIIRATIAGSKASNGLS